MTKRSASFLIAAGGVLVVAGAAFFLLRRQAHPEASGVRIISARGAAETYHPATAAWEKAAPGTALPEGEAVFTGPGGSINLGEERLYALRIGNDSILSLRPADGNERAFQLKEGRIWAATFADFTGKSLVVLAGRTRLTARGTAFAVAAGPGAAVAVAVESGEVEIAGNGGEPFGPVAVTAGLSWNWSGEGNAPRPVPLPPPRAKALREEIAEIGRSAGEVRRPAPDEGTERPVSLILSDSPRRVDELLMPCGLYVSESAPLDVYNLLLKASETARDGDYEGSIKMLKQALDKFPDRRAEAPLKLLIGAQYWALLDRPAEAIAYFEEAAREGDPEHAALAQAAIGLIYDKLSRRAFGEVLKRVREGPEAERAREAVGK